MKALINAMFQRLQPRHRAATPQVGWLASSLIRVVESTSGSSCQIDRRTLNGFATASVEMWQRSVHSFLISASLTAASPLWACVAGYYSSHYAVRALAHLLGYFQLTRKKRILRVELDSGMYVCHIKQKQAGDREHKLYWRIVHEHPPFTGDPFFTRNEEGQPSSDVGHRSVANYFDHVGQFPEFRALDEDYLRDRVQRIASIEVSAAPIPRIDSFPDTENVQLVAYHRMVRYRDYLDGVLGISNSFWRVHRKPEWCPSFLDFQVVQPNYVSAYKEHIA